MAHVRLAVREDAEYLAPRLRKEDVEEIYAASGDDPLTALLHGLEASTPCYSIINDRDEVVGMFGAGPLPMPNLGFVWMLAAPGLVEVQVPFLRQSRRWIEQMHKDVAPVLTNVVDARNEVHIKWLRWCGFTFLRRIEDFGFEKRQFIEFVRLQHV